MIADAGGATPHGDNGTLETMPEPPSWELHITRANNGYILDGRFGDSDHITEFVIQEDEQDELKAHEELLWEVMEYFNFGGSKHDNERLRVTREKQED